MLVLLFEEIVFDLSINFGVTTSASQSYDLTTQDILLLSETVLGIFANQTSGNNK